MDYAIVELQGAQYILKPGETVKVNGTLGQVDSNLTLGRTLAIKDNELLVGKPTLPDAVTYKVVKHLLSEKVRVGKFTAKSRYRKVNGHRQGMTVLEFVNVGSRKSEAPAKKVAPKIEPKVETSVDAAKSTKTESKKAPTKKTAVKTKSK